MRRLLSVVSLTAVLFAVSSCNSGPKRLGRTWDDWTNQKYSENAWLHGLLLQDLLPVYPIVGLVLGLGDAIIVNPYYFWTEDVWDGKGTAFEHDQPDGAERSVSGFMDK